MTLQRILVVDDESLAREYLAEAVTTAGWRADQLGGRPQGDRGRAADVVAVTSACRTWTVWS